MSFKVMLVKYDHTELFSIHIFGTEREGRDYLEYLFGLPESRRHDVVKTDEPVTATFIGGKILRIQYS